MSVRTVQAVGLIALPWLYPFVYGPTPSVAAWLFSAACGVLLWFGRRALSPEQVLQGWVIAATVSTFIGLLQYVGATAGLEPWLAAAAPGEAYGNLRQRNHYATLTSLGLAALLGLRAFPCRAAPPLSVALPLAALMAIANAASASRTGMLQILLLLAGALVWGWWRRPDGRRLLLAISSAYVLAALLLPLLLGLGAGEHGIWARLRTEEHSCNSRLLLWRNVLQLIAARPWVGWGWGELDYAHFSTLYDGPRFCELLDNAHNLPLHLAVELGLPVALLLVGGIVALAVRARPWRETEPSRQAAWMVLSLVALHSLLEYPLWYGPFQLAVLLSLWLLRYRALPERTQAGMALRARDAAAALTLAVSISYAAWDYWRISQIYLPPEARSSAYRTQTLEKIQGDWLYGDQVRFATFITTPLTVANAAAMRELGMSLLHFSPESRVVAKLVDSMRLLGQEQEARLYEARFRAAYPEEHGRWLAAQDDAQSGER